MGFRVPEGGYQSQHILTSAVRASERASLKVRASSICGKEHRLTSDAELPDLSINRRHLDLLILSHCGYSGTRDAGVKKVAEPVRCHTPPPWGMKRPVRAKVHEVPDCAVLLVHKLPSPDPRHAPIPASYLIRLFNNRYGLPLVESSISAFTNSRARG